MEQFTSQVTVAVIVVMVIETLKRSQRFSWINAATDRINRLLASIAAVLSGLGIQVAYSAESGVLTLSGLTLETAINLIWRIIAQYVLQEVIYRASYKR